MDIKPRYEDMVAKNVPMFRVMRLTKNVAHFVSSTQGRVGKVNVDRDSGWIEVKFVDGEKIKMPYLSTLNIIVPGSRLVLQEVHRKDVGRTLINLNKILDKLQ